MLLEVLRSTMFSMDNIEETMTNMLESFQKSLASGLQQLSKTVSPNQNRDNREEIRQRIVQKYWSADDRSPDTRVATARTDDGAVSVSDNVGFPGRHIPPTGHNANLNRPSRTEVTRPAYTPTDRLDRINSCGCSSTVSRADCILTSRMNGACERSMLSPTRNRKSPVSVSPVSSYEMNPMMEDLAQHMNAREITHRTRNPMNFHANIELTVQYLESMKLLRVVMMNPPNLPVDNRKLYAEVHLSHGWENQQIQKQTVEFMRPATVRSYKHVCYFNGYSLDEVSKMAISVKLLRRRLLVGSKTAGKAVVYFNRIGDLRSEKTVVGTLYIDGDRLSSE